MSSDAVQVPAEQLGRWDKNLTGALDILDRGALGSGEVVRLVEMARAELRGLLPQPAPTCPYCGHEDDDHRAIPLGELPSGIGCYLRPAFAGPECDCPFSREALDTVRALLAAQADAKPAELNLGGVVRRVYTARSGCDDCSVEPGETHRYPGCPGNERAAKRDARALATEALSGGAA